MDPAAKTRTIAFDHEKLAAALSAATGQTYTARRLPFAAVDMTADGKTVSFDIADRRWSCDLESGKCAGIGPALGGRGGRGGRGGSGRGGAAGNAVTSPDGKRAAFIRDSNLWVRDIASGQEKQLTTDGAKDYGYATDNAGWRSSERAILLWSPDSKKIATYRQDERKVGDMYLVETRVGHPVLKAWKYPIINNAYPGPQSGSVGSRAFAAARGDRQALAELGFVVVSIDGMGTPGRYKEFHDAYYGAMGRDNTLPDQVAGMKQLAERFPYIDIGRAAIWGHSGGGFIAADAMFRYPDFFKVGISESGNHDQRQYEDDWGERYQRLLVKKADETDNYEAEANQTVAANLKGRLLLAHGTMDNNVPPYNTLLVVDTLIKANKDFDLLLLPNQAHGFGSASSYMMRRRWDYFVKWLLGVEPPKEYRMQQPQAGRGGSPPG